MAVTVNNNRTIQRQRLTNANEALTSALGKLTGSSKTDGKKITISHKNSINSTVYIFILTSISITGLNSLVCRCRLKYMAMALCTLKYHRDQWGKVILPETLTLMKCPTICLFTWHLYRPASCSEIRLKVKNETSSPSSCMVWFIWTCFESLSFSHLTVSRILHQTTSTVLPQFWTGHLTTTVCKGEALHTVPLRTFTTTSQGREPTKRQTSQFPLTELSWFKSRKVLTTMAHKNARRKDKQNNRSQAHSTHQFRHVHKIMSIK